MKLEKLAMENSSQELAGFTHGVLFALHSLGAYYNIRRGNKTYALIHSIVAVYDLVSIYKHTKNIQDDVLVDRLREAGL